MLDFLEVVEDFISVSDDFHIDASKLDYDAYAKLVYDSLVSYLLDEATKGKQEAQTLLSRLDGQIKSNDRLFDSIFKNPLYDASIQSSKSQSTEANLSGNAPWGGKSFGTYIKGLKKIPKPEIEAQYLAGCAFIVGQGIKPDCPEAFKWYQMAALKEHPLAQFMLADMYYIGLGVKEDKNKALEYYRKSSDNGCEMAKF
ncbi:MAG: sel1 repeat family protein, partial [Deltaproteobacteria bacterium]|nr:sel1 repeat family protein [Deltaproteobacteria bacterium]